MKEGSGDKKKMNVQWTAKEIFEKEMGKNTKEIKNQNKEKSKTNQNDD